MAGTFNNAGLFLISTLFDLYIFVLLVRFILAYVRADYFNPLTQIFIKLTQPIISPLRRLIPNYKNIELATILLALVLEFVKFFLFAVILKSMPNIAGVIILALADGLRSLINIFFYAILLQAIISWIHQGYSPASDLLQKITLPVMRPFHRFIPPIGGIDLSPIPAMLVLQLIIIMLVTPLYAMGQAMAFG